MKSDIKKTGKRNRVIRFSILMFVLLLTTAMGLIHQYGTSFKFVSFDSFCPFGGLESLLMFITEGNMLKRTNFNDFVLLGVIAVLAVVFRRTFCGNICPLGTLQELFGKLRGRFLKKRYEIPVMIDKPLRYLKYVVLIGFITATWIVGELVMRPYGPWPAYQHILSDELFIEFPVGFAVLAVSLIGSFFYDRFLCKYLCPMGALLAIIGKIGIFRVRRNTESCINCKLCSNVCPVNINVHELEDVKSSECLNCNECVNVCPVENTLTISGRKKGRVGSLSFAAITFIAMLAIIGVTSVSGDFIWLQETLGTSGNLADFNPENIRGKYTFSELSKATGISPEVIMKEFDLTDQEFTEQIKESGLQTEMVREFVRQFKE